MASQFDDDMTLKGRSFDDDSAIEEGVDHLLRDFDALTEEPAPVTAAAAGGFTGPIEPTILVASHAARPEIRAVADFKLDGIADHVEMNQALADTYSAAGGVTDGGRVVMAEGDYRPSGAILVDQQLGNALVGVGRGTVLISPSDTAFASTALIVVADWCEVGDFLIDELGGGG